MATTSSLPNKGCTARTILTFQEEQAFSSDLSVRKLSSDNDDSRCQMISNSNDAIIYSTHRINLKMIMLAEETKL